MGSQELGLPSNRAIEVEDLDGHGGSSAAFSNLPGDMMVTQAFRV
jgi:hypothetical protein